MSHLKERKEKNCLNCNAEVMGRFCHICGQENVETKESAWHLINHFFQDITHFDSKFFSTLGLLIRRPGFLSAEYMRGRRMSYLNPVRMYIFTSAFFFLIFFTVFKNKEEGAFSNGSTINGKTLKQVAAMDSTMFAAFTTEINKGDNKPAKPMTREEFEMYYDSVINDAMAHGNWDVMNVTDMKVRSRREYDSLLNCGAIHDNWFRRQINYKQLELNKKYAGRAKDAIKDFGEIFMHKLPQLLFVSLPLLALLLKLLYIRRRQFYYVDHGIFSIHLYIFTFIALLISMTLGKVDDEWHSKIISYLQAIIVMGLFFYVYKAMRHFYQQRRAKTIAKFFLLNFLFLIVVTILLILFFFFSLLSL